MIDKIKAVAYEQILKIINSNKSEEFKNGAIEGTIRTVEYILDNWDKAEYKVDAPKGSGLSITAEKLTHLYESGRGSG